MAISSLVIEELRKHKTKQAEELLRLGIRQIDMAFVYGREDGEPMQPGSLTHAWQQMLVRCGLLRDPLPRPTPRTCNTPPSLRRSPKVASERLGHSKVGITLDLYSHVLPGMQAEAAARVDHAMRAALQKRHSATQG